MSRRGGGGMTRRRQDRASAFAARAYWDGNLQEYTAATRAQWAHEDRARELRARRVRALLAVPLGAWLVILGVGVLLAFAALRWVGQHPIQTTLIALAVIGAFAARYVMRQDQPQVVEAEEVAPPDVRRAQAQLDPLRVAMTAEARATHDALPAGSGRYYLQALEQGVLPAPTRSRGDGCDRITVPLPGGRVAPSDVRLDRFAQTLALPATRVRRGPDQPGVLNVEVLDVDPADLTVPAWPSLGRVTSWADPCPIGVDELGAPVEVPLMGARVMVAGQSGSGKTVTLRLLAMYAAADPAVRLHIFDHKGDGDFDALADRAATYHATGANVPDEVVDELRAIRDRMRAHREAAGRGERPEVVPTVVVIDECQALASKREALEIVEELALQGRSIGYSVLLGTQLATKKAVPVAILAVCDVRVVMRQGAAWAGEQLLQDSRVDVLGLPNGHAQVWDMRADRRTRVGVHYVDDEGAQVHMRGVPALPPAPDMPVIVEAHEGDADDDEGPDEDAPDLLLLDVQSAIAGRAGIGWDELADALGMTRAEVQAALRPHGITSAAFYSQETKGTVRGVRAVDVEAALGA